jgi:predicted transcriptional regulator
MATETKTALSDELRIQMEQIAREQNREPAEVLDEAVRRYVAVQRLERLALKGEERARKLGIREEDVPRLVDEVRRENRDRGR